MSIPVRHSGRIAFAALIVITLIATLIGVRLFAVAAAPPPRFEIGTTTEPTFTIGPVEGLTTTWHWAPRATSIPLGTIAEFFQPAPPDATVNWTGAAEVARDDQGSTAVCPLVLPGITLVQVQVIPAHGGEAFSSQSSFNVVDIDVEQITVSAIDAWVDSIEIDENLPQDEINEQTMDYFFGLSIAALRDLGDDQYRTSVNRMVQMSVEVDPPGFAPLIEWRFDGEPVQPPPTVPGGSLGIDLADGMGTLEQWRFLDIGNHIVEVGPLSNPEQIEIETYSVTITSHTSGQDTIPEGEPIVFVAETDPPGYEDEITWLSSTLYGTAEPILGEGPIFIAEFNETWGYDPGIGPWQWLGVKADNAPLNQDQKLGYGVRLENGEYWAFIEVVGGPELIAAPFDPDTAQEDHARARLIGLTVLEMADLIGQPNEEQIALLQSATVWKAGDLWKGDPPFPDFDGSEGERRILQTLSAILRLMHLKVAVIAPPWVPNGCTGIPCFLLRAATIACCNAHDACYCAGGNAFNRLLCDVVFLGCIAAGGHPGTAVLFFVAVRAFGAPHFNFTPAGASGWGQEKGTLYFSDSLVGVEGRARAPSTDPSREPQ